MSKIIRKIKSTIVFSILFLVLTSSMINSFSEAKDKPYNVKVIMNITWDLEETQKPVLPRDEIKELNLILTFKVVFGDYFGKGAALKYFSGTDTALVDLSIVETSQGCYAVLKQTRFEIKIAEYDEVNVKLYLSLDDTVPAYSDGYVKIKVSCPKLGLIEGFTDVFSLHFTPSYKPIIKANLPKVNTQRINPSETAVFPIEVENLGNARTAVDFEIENVPEGWEATVTEQVLLKEKKGSKATAYLTVVPPNQIGFHYDEANIQVKITPAQAENPDEKGQPLFATFTVQNRGSSANGIELVLFILMIIILIIVAIIFILKRMRNKKEKTLP